MAELRASNALKTLENAWADEACLHIAIASSDLPLPAQKDLNGADQQGAYTAVMRAGQQAHFAATLTQPQGGALAPGTYSIELYRSGGSRDAGSGAPTGGSFGTAPLPFAYTAPTQDWTPRSGNDMYVSVKARSHQGQALGVIEISPTAGYRLVYTHTSTASFSYPYGPDATVFQDHGTYSEQRDVALSASVPLTLDAARATATGSAPLTWQRSSWATDQDDISHPVGNLSIWCDMDRTEQVTGTTPGTLRVRSLRLGPPGANGRPTVAGLDVALAQVGEHWHVHETGGPCPVSDSDRDDHRFLNQFGNFHALRGDEVSWAVDPSDPTANEAELEVDSGWVPGSGDVIAQRTFAGDLPDGAAGNPPASALVHWTDTFQLVEGSG